jgi:hypothetical protein
VAAQRDRDLTKVRSGETPAGERAIDGGGTSALPAG